jgi:peptide/nickel transport system substrate-binding protein
MENRFTVKDAFLFMLIVIAIALIGLSMKQYDRQWTKIQALENQNNALTRDIVGLRDLVQDISQRPPTPVVIQNVLPSGQVLAPTTQASGATVTQQNAVASAANDVGTAIPQVTPVVPAIDGGANGEDNDDPFYRLKLARAKPDFAPGDWMIHNFGVRVGRLTPFVNEDVYGSTVRARVMETLLTRDPYTLKWKPLLAESYELSPDGLELRYKLRRNVVFSDGTPFSADDVIFTFDWVMNEVVDAARVRSYLTEQGVSWEKINDYEVLFRMKKSYFKFPEITGDMVILSKKFYSQYSPTDYNERPGLLIGTGPFRLRDPQNWTPGQRIELVRNERYWGTKPAFNRIIYTEVEEEAPSTTMFQNGEIDVLPCTPEQFDQLKSDPRATARANGWEYPSLLGGYTYIGWNQDRAGKPTAFADKRVRQAMTMLIDRERMAKEIWRGHARVARGPFSINGKQAAPDIEPWPYDPDRAKKQLAELGFADRNGDGVLDTPDGQPFRFELIYGSKSEIGQRVALFLKDSFARGGIVMEMAPTDWPILLDRLNKRDFDAITLGWSASVEGDLYQIFHSSQRKDGGDNRTGYVSPELDKLIEQARSSTDEEKRMQLWQQCTRVLHEDQPYTFLLDRNALVFIDKRIHNVERTRMGLNSMSTEVIPIPWYVPKGQQKYTE